MATIADLELSQQGKDFIASMVKQGKIPDEDLDAMSTDVAKVSDSTKELLRNAVRGQFVTAPSGWESDSTLGKIRQKVAGSEAVSTVADYLQGTGLGQVLGNPDKYDITNMVTDPATIGSVAAQAIPVVGEAAMAAKGAAALSKVPMVRNIAGTVAETAMQTGKGIIGNVAARQAVTNEGVGQSIKSATGEELAGTALGAAVLPGFHAIQAIQGKGDLIQTPAALSEFVYNRLSKTFNDEKSDTFLGASRRLGLQPGTDYTLGMATEQGSGKLRKAEEFAAISQKVIKGSTSIEKAAESARARLQRSLYTQVVKQNPTRGASGMTLSTGEVVPFMSRPDAIEVGNAIEKAAVYQTLSDIQNKGIELPGNVIELINGRKYGEAVKALDKGVVNDAYTKARAKAAPLKVDREWATSYPGLSDARYQNIGSAIGQPYGTGSEQEAVRNIDRVINDYVIKNSDVAKRLGSETNPQYKIKAITVKDIFDARDELKAMPAMSGKAEAYRQTAISTMDDMLTELGHSSTKEYSDAVGAIRQAEATRAEYQGIVDKLKEIVPYDTKGVGSAVKELFQFDGQGSFRGIDLAKWNNFVNSYGNTPMGQNAIKMTKQHLADQIATEIAGRTSPDIKQGAFNITKSAEAINKVVGKYGERQIREILGPDFLQFVKDYQTVADHMSTLLKEAKATTSSGGDKSPLQQFRSLPILGLAMLTYYAPAGTAAVAVPSLGMGALMSKLYFSGLPKAVVTGEYVINKQALQSRAIMTRLTNGLFNSATELTDEDKQFIMSIMEPNNESDSNIGPVGAPSDPGSTIPTRGGNSKEEFQQYLNSIPNGGSQGTSGKTQSPDGFSQGMNQGVMNATTNTGDTAGLYGIGGSAKASGDTGVSSNYASEVSRTLVAGEEGLHTKVYKDGNGFRTVGFGFNMDAAGAEAEWKQSGIPESYTKVLAGKQQLSNESAVKLYDVKHAKAENIAKAVVKSYDSLQPNQQAALTSLAYQLGKAGLSAFKNTLNSLEKGDMQGVYNGLVNSKMGKTDSPIRTKIQALMLTQNMSPEQAEQYLLDTKQIKETQLRHTVKDPRITALLTGNKVA